MQPTSTTMPPSSRVMDGLVVPDIISSRWRLSGLDGCLTQFNRNTKTTLYIHLVGCNLSLNLVGDRRINRGRSRNGAGPDPDERRFCFPDRHVGWAIHISGFRSLSLPPRSESSVSARASCWSSAFLAADGCNGTLYIVQRHAAARRDRDRLHEFYLFCPLGRLGGRATVLCRRSPGSSLFSHLSLTSTSGPIRGDLDVGSALLRRRISMPCHRASCQALRCTVHTKVRKGTVPLPSLSQSRGITAPERDPAFSSRFSSVTSSQQDMTSFSE
jgi:hypothetical protein